jgi:NDP-sugar pyrophosphorylase family protein
MTQVRTAVVLAGGAGLRLRPLTNDKPKAMIEVLGKPLLQWIIEWLKNNGVEHLIIGVAYKKEAVMDYFGDGSRFGLQIDYSVHSVEGETGEGFRLAINRFVKDNVFLAMNGDMLTDLDLRMMVDFHFSHRAIATIAVTPLKSPFGVINVASNNDVISFEEKPILDSVLINSGIYTFDRQIIDYLPEKGSLEKVTFPTLANLRLLKAYYITSFWLTINTLKDLENAEHELRKLRRKIEVWQT